MFMFSSDESSLEVAWIDSIFAAHYRGVQLPAYSGRTRYQILPRMIKGMNAADSADVLKLVHGGENRCEYQDHCTRKDFTPHLPQVFSDESTNKNARAGKRTFEQQSENITPMRRIITKRFKTPSILNVGAEGSLAVKNIAWNRFQFFLAEADCDASRVPMAKNLESSAEALTNIVVGR